MSRRTAQFFALSISTVLVGLASVPGAQAADSHSQITGSGSSWSANAVNQWVADVQSSGLQVVFTGTGSQIGRKDFANVTTDFGVTDIGYQGTDKVTGQSDTAQNRAFAYLPIVAGGTAFPYHLKVAGKLVRNLRLSGSTLVGIFTNKITNWDDKAITADNNGHGFPSKPIIPIVHSEGSGSSAQFTRYLDALYPSVWRPYQGSSGGTEYFPRKGNALAQDGSDGVMNYIASDAGDGTIGYDEFSYALGKNYPVAKLENAAGYFTSPSQYDVAVALTKAKINMDKTSPNYLLQDLSGVYRYSDPRTYAMSSYSYMIIPTGAKDGRMTTAKRQTIVDFLNYSICQGQKEMGPIGYSPLPINLAQASFDQVGKLKTADPKVDLANRNISTCGNPTFVASQPSKNHLAEIAPQPSACDKAGAGPCSSGGVVTANPDSNGKAPAAPAGGGSTGNSGGGTGSTAGGTGTAAAGGKAGAAAAGGGTLVVTGGATAGGATGTSDSGATSGDGSSTDLAAVPTELASSRRPVSTPFLAGLAILLLVVAVVVPPLTAPRDPRR